MPVRSARGLSRLLVLSAALLVLAACAEEAGSPEAADTPDVDDATDENPDDDAVADPGVRLEVTDSELGTHLVDGEGMTVYLFAPDEAGESTCDDACAESWPPVLGDDPDTGDGVDEELVGTTTRDDGEVQVTYDGWPLYHFSGDEQPGEATGQGVNDAWFVIGPDGDRIDTDTDTDAHDGSDDGSDDEAGGARY